MNIKKLLVILALVYMVTVAIMMFIAVVQNVKPL